MKKFKVKYHDYEDNDYEKIVNEYDIYYVCEVLAHMIDSIEEVN